MSTSTPVAPPETVSSGPYLVAMRPEHPTPVPEIVAALRTIAQLEGLSDEEYTWLANHGEERMGQTDAMIFREGEPASNLNFVLRGEIHVRRRRSGPVALFIGRAGQMTGKLPFSRMKGYGGDGYAIGEVWVFDIHEDHFPAMLQAIPSMAQRCVSVLLDRVREVTRMEQQAEKLSALGKLAGNLAHELNNPASAAQRSASGLYGDLRSYGDQMFWLGALSRDVPNSEQIGDWVERTRDRLRASAPIGPSATLLAVSDREDTITKWLEARCVHEPWTLAPTLAESGIGFDQLDELAQLSPEHVLPLLIAAFTNSLRAERLSETIVDATRRIFDLISAIKDYSYMDQAPVQEVDLAQSLSNALVMQQSRLEHIRVETDFDASLPCISAFGSELSQVWTALIENALDGMGGSGTLRLRTRMTGALATVDIEDTGRGIAPEHLSRIFEPFFTTKPPGAGLGLGLDTASRIVSRHSGLITVESRPGRTCFQVRLPIERAEAY